MAQAAMGPFYSDFWREKAQKEALGGTALDPNSVLAAVYGEQSARYQREREMGIIQTQKEQEAARLAQRQSEFGVTSDLAKQKLEQEQWTGIGSMAMNVPITAAGIEYMTKTPATATTPAQGGWVSKAGNYVMGEGTTATATTAAPAYTTATGEAAAFQGAEYGGAAAGEGAAAGTGVTAGMVAWPAAAGYVGAKYGPWKEESGRMATFGMGGTREQKIGGGALRGGGAGAIVGTMIMPGIGSAVGFVVGAIVGGITEGTVICTELLRQGFVSQEMIDFEHKYQHNFDWATYWGYRLVADPIVIKMSKSRRFSRLVALFGVPFLNEIAHRVDPQRKGSRFGALILKFGVPFCKWNFNRVARKYRKLTAWHQGIRENCNG